VHLLADRRDGLAEFSGHPVRLVFDIARDLLIASRSAISVCDSRQVTATSMPPGRRAVLWGAQRRRVVD
jgi:hypothetical protein